MNKAIFVLLGIWLSMSAVVFFSDIGNDVAEFQKKIKRTDYQAYTVE